MGYGLLLKIFGPIALAGLVWLWFDGYIDDERAKAANEVQNRWDAEKFVANTEASRLVANEQALHRATVADYEAAIDGLLAHGVDRQRELDSLRAAAKAANPPRPILAPPVAGCEAERARGDRYYSLLRQCLGLSTEAAELLVIGEGRMKALTVKVSALQDYCGNPQTRSN